MTEDELDRACSILNSSQSFKGKWPLRPSHPSWFDNSNNVSFGWGMTLLNSIHVEVSGKSGAVFPQGLQHQSKSIVWTAQIKNFHHIMRWISWQCFKYSWRVCTILKYLISCIPLNCVNPFNSFDSPWSLCELFISFSSKMVLNYIF
jgi:hypothetical protein